MELTEAFEYIESLEMNTLPVDFSKFTDEELLSISITLDLISEEEAVEFERELYKRNLTEEYFLLRKNK